MQATAISTRIQTFLCPSSPLPSGNNESGKPSAGNNYFAFLGSYPTYSNAFAGYCDTGCAPKPNGVFMPNSAGIRLDSLRHRGRDSDDHGRHEQHGRF